MGMLLRRHYENKEGKVEKAIKEEEIVEYIQDEEIEKRAKPKKKKPRSR